VKNAGLQMPRLRLEIAVEAEEKRDDSCVFCHFRRPGICRGKVVIVGEKNLPVEEDNMVEY